MGNLIKQFTVKDKAWMRLKGAQISQLFPDWLENPNTEFDWLVLPGFIFPNSLP